MRLGKISRVGSMAILILAVSLLSMPFNVGSTQAAGITTETRLFTFKALNASYLNGGSSGGSYLDTYYDDAYYHTSVGRMVRIWDPDYGRLIYYALDVVYTFNVNSSITIPLNFVNISCIEVNGKGHTDENSVDLVELYMFNYRVGGWQTTGTGFLGSTSDQFVNWTTVNSCSDYVGSSGDMKLRWGFFTQDFNRLYLNYQCIKLTLTVPHYAWTFMVYLDADWCFEIPGDIPSGPIYLMPPPPTIIPGEQLGYQEMNEMETIGSTSNVAIIVQIDRYYGGADRYYIAKDNDTSRITSPVLQTLGEVNMADPVTLTNFINWTNFWYPADRLLLVMHDHGQGFLGCMRDETSGDEMSMTELKTALSTATTAIGKKIDVIGFIACLMQMTEVAYQIKDYGRVLIASEEVMYAALDNGEINAGWPFDTILANVTAAPSMDGKTLARVVIDRFKEFFLLYSNYIDRAPTISAIDLMYPNFLGAYLDSFAGILINKLNPNLTAFIQDCRSRSQQFYFTPYIDLYNFTQSMYASTDPDIRQSANLLMFYINKTAFYEWHWPYASPTNPWPPIDAHGISIFFPQYSSTYTEYRATYEGLDFSQTYRWDDFLRAYFGIT
jgi:hypothetical protein